MDAGVAATIFAHKSGAIMLRRAREVEAAAIHALLWSAKEVIPLVEAFHTEPCRKWVEERCKEKLVWVVVKRATIIGAMVMQGNELFFWWSRQNIGERVSQGCWLRKQKLFAKSTA